MRVLSPILTLLLSAPLLNAFHVCPTFPYCALQPSGVWSSLPTRVIPEQPRPRLSDSSCWFQDTYCVPPDTSSRSGFFAIGNSTTAASCQKECDETPGCSFFTFLLQRGQPHCSLHSTCDRANRCSAEEKDKVCVSGPPRCSCSRLDRSSQTKEKGVRYTSWKCEGGINPYISDIPTGTKCTTTCPAWRETLESRCVAGNQWTKTIGTKPSTGVQPPSVESSAAFRALPYATTIYNTPDMEDMVCGCQDLGPFDYNPNNFTEAKLVCTGREPKNFDAPWTLTTTDRCDLFCNDVPAGSVFCDGTRWVGQPEKGFWCYEKPEHPEPSCVLVTKCAPRLEEVCQNEVDTRSGVVARTCFAQAVQDCTEVCDVQPSQVGEPENVQP